MDKPVAVINGTPIRKADLENAVQGLTMELHRKTMDQLTDKEQRAISEMALEKLIARELIYQAALARGVVADEEAIEKERQKIIDNFPSEEEFYATLEKAGIDSASYHRMLRQDLTVNRMTEQQLAGMDPPTEEQIEQTYRRHPEKMKSVARVRASHILVRIPEGEREQAFATIRELRNRATGEGFADLARRHSACPSAPGGGDLGYFRRGEMARSFEEAAFSQPVGEVGEVVETQFGFHLIKVLDRDEETPLSLSEATPKIRRFLEEEAASRRIEAWVARLKADAEIVLET